MPMDLITMLGVHARALGSTYNVTVRSSVGCGVVSYNVAPPCHHQPTPTKITRFFDPANPSELLYMT